VDIKCKDCKKTLESIERVANTGPPIKIHFVPKHRRKSLSGELYLCNRTYMRALPEEIVSPNGSTLVED
jgi:hypothetical protein